MPRMSNEEEASASELLVIDYFCVLIVPFLTQLFPVVSVGLLMILNSASGHLIGMSSSR
jgi:hypothetical protein